MQSDSWARGGLEQFDWIPVWIEQLNLFAARAHDYIAPKLQAPILHVCDDGRKLIHGQHEAIPSAWFLLLAVWQGAGPGTLRATEKHVSTAARHLRECGPLLMLQLEMQVLRVKRHGAVHVPRLVPNSVNSKRSHGHVLPIAWADHSAVALILEITLVDHSQHKQKNFLRFLNAKEGLFSSSLDELQLTLWLGSHKSLSGQGITHGFHSFGHVEV
jgi:hypothetical protein